MAGLLIEFRDWWGRDEPPDASFLAGVRRLIAERDTEYLLGSVAGGEPAAVCQLRFRHGIWHDAEDCWLEDLFVRADARRSGLGAALTEAAIHRARERGCARIQLDVSEANPAALALYGRFGFVSGSGPLGERNLFMGLGLAG